MEDPNWAKIISHLYDSSTGRVQAPEYELGDSSGIEDTHPFVEELELSEKEAADALFQANEFGFLELTHQTEETISSDDLVFDMFKPEYPRRDSDLREYALRLSKRGFDVAHDRKMDNRQTRVNIGIAVLTVFLMIGSVLQGYSVFLNTNTEIKDILYLC